MSKRIRCISALGAVFFAVVGLSACGGIPGNAVVKVGDTSITKSTFAHWMSVAAASSATATPTTKPVVPEPPTYTACIAHLQAIAPKPAKGQSPPTPAELKSQCEQQYKALQQEVLGFLISAEWVIGEAAHLGVKATDAEVKKQLEQIKNQQFPKAADFEKFLASSGQTVSDLLLRVKLNLLSSKIQQKIAKTKANITQAEIAKVLQRKQAALRHTGKARHRDHPHQDRSGGQEGQAGSGIRQELRERGQVLSIDPTSKATGGLLTGVVKGQEEEDARRRDLLGQGERAERSREDALWLLHLRGQEHHRGQPADAGAGAVVDQAAADRHPAADGADQVRQRLQDEVDEQDGMSRGLRGDELQGVQSPQDASRAGSPIEAQAAQLRRGHGHHDQEITPTG